MSQCDSIHSTGPARPGVAPGVYISAAVVFALSVALTIYFCRTMGGGMDMPGGWTMSMMWMRMPGQSWVEAAGMFELMWGAMMIAMMLPSSLPVMLQYYRMRRSRGGGGAIVGTGLMASGYFFVWTVAGVIIYLPGVFWASAAMRWGALSRAMPVVIGATLVVAGLWQFTPWKKYGLSRCRGPMSCGAPQTRDTVWSAWRQGVDCGLCCVLCCFGPTLILLALGMMNLAVIIAVAAMIALEKLAPEPKYFIRIAGVIAVLGGMAIIVRAALQA